MPALTLVALAARGRAQRSGGTGGLSAARARDGPARRAAGRPCARSARAATQASRFSGSRRVTTRRRRRRGRGCFASGVELGEPHVGLGRARVRGRLPQQPVGARQVLRRRAHGGDALALVADRHQVAHQPRRRSAQRRRRSRRGRSRRPRHEQRADGDRDAARATPARVRARGRRGRAASAGARPPARQHGGGERLQVVARSPAGSARRAPRPRARRRTSGGAGRAGTAPRCRWRRAARRRRRA